MRHCNNFLYFIWDEYYININVYFELSFSVDKDCIWHLTNVNSKSARISLSSVFVHPITDEYHVGRQIIIIEIAVWVFAGRLSNNYASIKTIQLVQTGMRVPKMGTCITCSPLVSRDLNTVS